MNIFIITIPTEFDCYTVDVPYVYITGATFDSLWKHLCNAMEAAKTFQVVEDKLEMFTKHPEVNFGKLKIDHYQLLSGKIRVYKLEDWLRQNNIHSERIEWSNFKCEL
jgi:hypothetical protein